MVKNKAGNISENLYLLCACKIEQKQNLLLKFEIMSAINSDFGLVSI
jgi:hypothetical protein